MRSARSARFTPAEVVAGLAALPRPRVLITTPVHLRLLVSSGLQLPGVDLVVSATAPLSQELARASEAAFGAALQEIYGSTETGQIASRRTANEADWTLWPGVTLQVGADGAMAQGGHVEQPMLLQDVIEMTDATRFRLHGRTADMVNIAGKRSSLGYPRSSSQCHPGCARRRFRGPRRRVRCASGATRGTRGRPPPSLPRPCCRPCARASTRCSCRGRCCCSSACRANATGKLPRATVEALIAARTRAAS